MKLYLSILVFWVASLAGMYTFGQYVGVFKMQAHLQVFQASNLQAKVYGLYKFPTPEDRLNKLNSLNNGDLLKAIESYEWYLNHWSSSMPSVSDLDERTKRMYKWVESTQTENQL